jgi:hypothetical protein
MARSEDGFQKTAREGMRFSSADGLILLFYLAFYSIFATIFIDSCLWLRRKKRYGVQFHVMILTACARAL